jgi:general secretion pathway protein I
MPNDPERRAGRRVPRSRGFTLIEVLVALVVVAVSMTAAILAVSERTRDGTYLRDKTLAHWIAMNLVTERRLQAQPPALGKTSDEIEYAGRRWRWTVLVDKTAIDTMRRMDVSVRTVDAPEDSSLATVTGFYGTAIASPGTADVGWDVGPLGGGQGAGVDENDTQGEEATNDDNGTSDEETDATDDGSDEQGSDTGEDTGGDDSSEGVEEPGGGESGAGSKQ